MCAMPLSLILIFLGSHGAFDRIARVVRPTPMFSLIGFERHAPPAPTATVYPTRRLPVVFLSLQFVRLMT